MVLLVLYVAFAMLFRCFAVLSLCLVDPIEHCDHLVGKDGAMVCGLCTIRHVRFGLPLGVIGRLFPLIVTLPGLPGLLLYYFNVFRTQHVCSFVCS